MTDNQCYIYYGNLFEHQVSPFSPFIIKKIDDMSYHHVKQLVISNIYLWSTARGYLIRMIG